MILLVKFWNHKVYNENQFEFWNLIKFIETNLIGNNIMNSTFKIYMFTM